MEAKAYLRILLRKWWIVIPVFLTTLAAGIVFTYMQTPVYSATTTYLVVPSSSFGDTNGFADGLDILGRRDEIATTFAEIASSHRIKALATDSLTLASSRDYTVSSELRAGTNIIDVTVEGPDPVIVRGLANAIGASVEEYVRGLYEVFTLVLLDGATVPKNNISPNEPLNLFLAAVLGLVLGAGLAFLSEYLEAPVTSSGVSVNIFDDETGIYNREYFRQRLGEEMVRARRNQYPLSLGLMRLENLSLIKGPGSSKVRAEMLRQAALLANQHLREEDIVARLDGDVLGLLLPDTTGEDAKALLEYLRTSIAQTLFESSINGLKLSLESVVGVSAYAHNGASRDELVALASRALQFAEVEDDARTFLMTDAPDAEDNAS